MDGTVTRWTCEIIPGWNLGDPVPFPSRKQKREPSVRLFIHANTCGSSWLMESRVHAGLRPHAIILSFRKKKSRNGRAHNQAFKTRSTGRLHVNASLKAATKLDRDTAADAFMQRRAIRGCHRGLKNGGKSSVIFRFPPIFLITSRGANY